MASLAISPQDSNPSEGFLASLDKFGSGANDNAPSQDAAPPQSGGSDFLQSLDDISNRKYAPKTAAKPERPATFDNLAGQAGAAANRTFASVLGAPADFMAGGLPKAEETARIESKYPELKGIYQAIDSVRDSPFFGSKWWNRQFGNVISAVAPEGHETNPQNIIPESGPEKVAAAVGQGAASVLPFAAAGRALEIPALTANTGGQLAKQVATIAAASGAGKRMSQEVPERWAPAVDAATQIVVGGGLGAAEEAGGRAVGGASKAVGDFFRPVTNPARAAGEEILNSATNPEAVRTALANQDATFVPGTKPTLAEATQDPGIATWQKTLRTGNPQPFNDALRAQQQAYNDAINSVAPQADSSAVGKFFASHLNALENTAGLVANEGAAPIKSATEALGGIAPQATYGEDLRNAIQEGAKQSQQQVSQLWENLKPWYGAKVDSTPVTEAVKSAVSEVNPRVGAQLTPDEQRIFGAVGQWGPQTTFGDLRALNGELAAAQRSVRMEYGDNSPPMRRLSMVKKSLDEALENTVNGIVESEKAAPQGNRLEDVLKSEVGNWYGLDGRQAPRAYAGQTTGGVSAGGSSPLPRTSGTEVRPTQGPGSGGGSEGVSGEALSGSIKAKYAEAKAATTAHHQLYDTGPVGQVLAPGSSGAKFKMNDADVGAAFVNAKRGSTQAIDQLIDAAGGPENAVEPLKNWAVSDLRRSGAILPDGRVDEGIFKTWLKRNGPALEHPALSDLKSSLANVQAAQDTYNSVQAASKQAVEDFQKSAAAKFIGVDQPEKVADVVGQIFARKDANKALDDLVTKMNGNPDAINGLKRAVADHILTNVRKSVAGQGSTAETPLSDFGSAAGFRKFLAENKMPLRRLFGGQGLNNLEMVAADMRRSAVANEALKTPGEPNTAEKGAALAKKATSVLGMLRKSNLIHWLVGGVAAHSIEHGNPWGLAAGAGVEIVNLLRQQGIKKIEDLEIEAALNPEVARILVSKVPEKVTTSYARRVVSSLTKAMGNATLSDSDNKESKQ